MSMNIFKRLFHRRHKPGKAERITKIYSTCLSENLQGFTIRASVRLATGEKTSVFLTDKKGRDAWKTRDEAAAVLAWAEKKMAARLARHAFLGRLACAVGLHLWRHRMNGGRPERVCERCEKTKKRYWFCFKATPIFGSGPAKKKTVDLWCERNPRKGK